MPNKSPAPAPKQYVVANPQGIPAGIRIIAVGEREWFEGDAIAAGEVGSTKGFADLIAQGYVVETGG